MTESRIPPAISPMMRDFAELLQSSLHHRALGLYIQGSAALGCFHPKRSDIDFIAVLDQPATDTDLSIIDNIHRELKRKHPYYKVTEGQYTTVGHLNKSVQEPDERFPKYFYGEAKGLNKGFIDPTSLWILKKHGITVFGPEVRDLGIIVEWPDLRSAMVYNLHVYWADKAKNREQFLEDVWVDDTVLTLGRIAYTLEHQTVITKDGGGRYLLEILPPCWHRLVHEALRIRQGAEEIHYESKEERADETQKLTLHLIDYCNQRYKLQP